MISHDRGNHGDDPAVDRFGQFRTKSHLKTLPLILILVIAGCTKQSNLPEDTTMSEQSADVPVIRKLAEDCRVGWLAGDAETLPASPDASMTAPENSLA